MSAFRQALEARAPDPAGRRWLFVPYDQLSDAIGPLSREDPGELGIVVVETRWKARRRPYHRQKLALVLASLRHFALEQAERGVAVRHVTGDAPYAELLEPLARELGPLRVMRPAERELRVDLAPLARSGALEIVPHEGWLTRPEQLEAAARPDGRGWRMDAFYRRVRRDTGVLMQDGRPRGGRWSFDADNRKPWRGDPPAPEPPRFPVDPVTQEVVERVERDFADHPGRLVPEDLPARREDAERAWRWALRHCLPHFGPFEDAMARDARVLFHTKISALLNNHRLLPARVIADVEALDAPIASVEGFVRQVLGWREFVHQVHDATDGFRRLPGGHAPPRSDAPGDAGHGAWRGRAWKPGRTPAGMDGGARPSALGARGPLPPAFWGAPSGLACLDRVVADVWETGYGHHITRLMVLSNLATLLNVSPRELCDWFWVAYVDAYDWVVEPNVLGMGSFGLGDLFVTKPYVSGAAYIDRMSDYCGGCAFTPGGDCPVTPLYWSFLERNARRLADNPRMKLPLRSLEKRGKARRRHDRRVYDAVRRRLRAGRRLAPGDLPTPP